jgi:adenine-specific DNA-methyltransferase
MPRATGTKQAKSKAKLAKPYKYPEADSPMRPEVGTQAQFKKKLPPKTYKYDSSLSPTMEWDGQNLAREQGEALVRHVLEAESLEQAKAAASKLKAISKPFLNWAGKAERLSFDVPSLPLFIHERLSTKAILETVKGHKKQGELFDLFSDPRHSIADQVLRAYEYRDEWVNRMILGDSLVVMSSLLQYEGMGGQVQMIYIDPPYGVKFGSNFQPFVRRRKVGHNDDEDMTREPEMVQAYRDTWELGLHSYLTFLRDRLIVSRELLTETGSVFLQISDENIHHVRELMDEVFGAENFVAVISFKTMMPLESGDIESVMDYLCWYAKDKTRLKYRNLFSAKRVGGDSEFVFADTAGGGYRHLTSEEIEDFDETAKHNAIFKRSDLASSGYTPSCTFPIEFNGEPYETKRGKSWRTTPEGIDVLKQKNRLFVLGKKLYFKMYLRDFGYGSLINCWPDTIE